MQKKTFSTKQMAMDAVLAAVCAVLGYFGPDLGNLKITFEGLPVIVAVIATILTGIACASSWSEWRLYPFLSLKIGN